GLGDALSGLTVDGCIEQDDRARGVEVPDIVVNLLEVPGVFACLDLQRDHRGAIQIVALTHRTIVVRAAIADREIEETELRIDRRRIPDRRATAHGMIGAGRPGLAAFLARSGQGEPAPLDLAGFGVERRQPAADAELAAGNAAVDHAVVIKWRAGD